MAYFRSDDSNRSEPNCGASFCVRPGRAGYAGEGEDCCQPKDAAEAEDERLLYCMLDTRVTRLDCGESRALLLDRMLLWCRKGKLIKPTIQVVSEGCKQHQPKERNGEQAGQAGNCIVNCRRNT